MSAKRDPYEPWLHQPSGFWCKKVNGKREYLSRDYREAKRKLHQIVDDLARGDSLSRNWLEAPFSQLSLLVCYILILG